MRTAILLSGQIRSAKYCIKSLMRHVVEPLQADIFIDTWIPRAYEKDRLGNLILNTLTIDEVLSRYRPRAITIEEFDQSPLVQEIGRNRNESKVGYDGSDAPETKLENIYYMHYKIWRANALKNAYEKINDIHYGRVIRLRFDLEFESFPEIEPERNTLYIPEGWDYRGGINDLLVVGDSESIDKYCDVYVNLRKYARAGIGFHPESILRHHLEASNVRIVRFELDYKLNGIDCSAYANPRMKKVLDVTRYKKWGRSGSIGIQMRRTWHQMRRTWQSVMNKLSRV